jgi:threonine aldolase
VFYDPSPLGLEYSEIDDKARQLPEPITLAGSRLVLHIQTSEVAVHDFLMLVQKLAEERRKAGWVRPEGELHSTGNVTQTYGCM